MFHKPTQTKDTTTMAKKNTESTNPLVQELSIEEIAALCEQGQQMPEVLALEEGQSFRGALIGPGGEIPYTDQKGDEKQLKTWNFHHASGANIEILSAYELDKHLPNLIGSKDVLIVKGKKKDIGGKMVNQFKVVNLDKSFTKPANVKAAS